MITTKAHTNITRGDKNISKIEQAFTLVELLVVMTIVGILATISSIYILGNFADSRDSVRLTDLGNIQTAMDIYYTDQGEYPDPDEQIDVLYDGSVAWTQGVFGSGVTQTMKTFGTIIPMDPNYGNSYSYSITNNASEYQIAGIIEGDEEEEGLGEIAGLIIPQAHADLTRALVLGDFNNFVVRTSSGSIDYYIATPSIISAELYEGIDVIDVITSQRLVYNDFFNLPANYNEYIDTLGGFNFNVTDPIVFSGSVDELKTQDGLLTFGENLKYIYATTPTESFDTFRRILDSDNTTTVLKAFLSKHFKVRFKSYFDCRDIYNSGDTVSGKYKIDPDGEGSKTEETVYCDMDTGGGGWTQKNITNFSNGDFDGGNNISSMMSDAGTSIVNLGASNTPVTSGYAIRQTTASSYYQIAFEDQLNQLTDLESGDEVRLSLWVRDDNDASSDSWDSCITDECTNNPSAGYAFSNTFYGNDGLNSVNGLAEIIETQMTADGNMWNKQLLRTKVTRELDDFAWWIGQGFGATKDIYITGVDIEVYYGGYEGYE